MADIGEFRVDLDHLEDVTNRIRGLKEYAIDQLTALDAKVKSLGPAWSGDAALAYAEAHRTWSVSAGEVQEGLQALQDAATQARENYQGAMAVNVRMLGR
ncbi:WXG100 family type VII secretion target [Nocardia sp. NPDC024068]|uniref:WXG100 family type VII secretion target n=1 Tax=Nocardia sp. NPDC024068 TaxID=3157197 RepID=UPI0033E10F3F